MFYRLKSPTVKAWQFAGFCDDPNWPDWLPKPVVVKEYNALFCKEPHMLYHLQSAVKAEQDGLYLITRKGYPNKVQKGYYFLCNVETGSFWDVSRLKFEKDYELVSDKQ